MVFVFFFTADLDLTSCFLPLDATVYVGGLDEKVSEPLLWELFLQAGPVVNTHMPKDRVTGQHQGKYVVNGPSSTSHNCFGMSSLRISFP